MRVSTESDLEGEVEGEKEEEETEEDEVPQPKTEEIRFVPADENQCKINNQPLEPSV